MFVVLQYPLADVRPFLENETGHLQYPTWPVPNPNKEFIRSSGVVEQRALGGIASWSGEEVYCTANNAIKFPSFLHKRPISAKENIHLHCAFRRFFHNEDAVSRVELGFNVLNSEVRGLSYWESNEIVWLIKGIFSLKVNIPGKGGAVKNIELLKCGETLAAYYLQATTKRISGIQTNTENWWISPGIPILVIHTDEQETNRFPNLTKAVKIETGHPKIKKDIVHYFPLKINGLTIPVWFLLGGENCSNDLLRNIRIHLLRLHAERECLKWVLRLIQGQKIQPPERSEQSDILQKYLLDQTRRILRKTAYGSSQSDLLTELQRAEEIVGADNRATFFNQLESLHIRKNVFNMVKKTVEYEDELKINRPDNQSYHNIFIDSTIEYYEGDNMSNIIKIGNNNVLVDNNLIQAKRVEDSANKIAASNKPADIKKQLEELHSNVAKMIPKLSEEDADEAAKNVDQLRAEVTSKTPDPQQAQTFADRLIKIANTAGQIAVPVIATLKTLLPLIAAR